MAFGKNQQPTTSSPPPQVIAPTTSKQPEVQQNLPVTPEALPQLPIEIKAPSDVTAGVPLSELNKVVKEEQQAEEEVATTDTAQPGKAMELGLVIVQLTALFVIIAGFIPPLLWQNTLLQVFGMLCIGVAIFIGVWAVISFKQKIRILPSPNPNGFLVTGGPFAFVRHPIYFALLLGSFGLAIAYPTIPRIIALFVLAFILHVKVGYEEAMLQERFNGYDKYKLHTGKLFPKLNANKQSSLAQPQVQSTKEDSEQ